MIQFGLGLLLRPMGTRRVSAIRSSPIGADCKSRWHPPGFGSRTARWAKFATCIGGVVVVAAIVSEAAIEEARPLSPFAHCERD
jgi:hypothetical protein